MPRKKVARRKKGKRLLKDRFTKAELIEFAIGVFFTLFLGFSTIDAIVKLMPEASLEHAVMLFVFTIGVCVAFLWLKKTHEWTLRIVTAVILSTIIVSVFYYVILDLDVMENLQLLLVSISVTTVGALTIDILRED